MTRKQKDDATTHRYGADGKPRLVFRRYIRGFGSNQANVMVLTGRLDRIRQKLFLDIGHTEGERRGKASSTQSPEQDLSTSPSRYHDEYKRFTE